VGEDAEELDVVSGVDGEVEGAVELVAGHEELGHDHLLRGLVCISHT